MAPAAPSPGMARSLTVPGLVASVAFFITHKRTRPEVETRGVQWLGNAENIGKCLEPLTDTVYAVSSFV